jgi:hypothetical protein
VPSLVETIGDRCFENCSKLATITFEESSRLRKIGKHAFAGSQLTSTTIPASTPEIDGSSFVGCPLQTLRDPSDQKFIVEGDLLLAANRTEIVRYFGRGLKIIVLEKVEVLGESCLKECNLAEQVVFEEGSKLQRICKSALFQSLHLLRR